MSVDNKKNEGKEMFDCFAYKKYSNNLTGCLALEEMLCKKGECPFYKPKKEMCKSCNKNRFHNCMNCVSARTRLGVTTSTN